MCDKLSHECAASANRFNIETEIVQGVYSDQDVLLLEKKLEFFKYKNLFSRFTRGVVGCFLSHFQLWEKAVKENKTIGIFEYDALMVRNIDPIIYNFTDIINFTGSDNLANMQTISKIPEIGELRLTFGSIKKNCLYNAHAYMVSPAGAKKLIDAAYSHGILFADLHMNLLYAEVYQPAIDIAIVNPVMQENRKSLSHTLNIHW